MPNAGRLISSVCSKRAHRRETQVWSNYVSGFLYDTTVLLKDCISLFIQEEKGEFGAVIDWFDRTS